MRYILLSYGRPHLQITLKNLPEEVRKSIEMWVVPSEYKVYKKAWGPVVKDIKVWPDHIDCVPKKRQWLARNIKESYMVFDDDISLSAWSNKHQRYLSPTVMPKLFARRFFDDLPQVFESYSGVSLSSKFMADQHAKKSLIKENTLGFVASGFSSGVVGKLEAKERMWFNRTFMFTDVALPLQVLQQTKSSCLYYGLVYNHSSNKELLVTATATYRDDFVKMDSAIKMARLFPGIIVGAEENGNKGGGMTLKKWFRRALTEPTDAHLNQSRVWVANTCASLGLSHPPKIFQYPDELPRAEIIEEFKTRWNQAKL